MAVTGNARTWNSRTSEGSAAGEGLRIASMRLSARTVLRKSAQPFLPDFLTVCAYVVLGFFLTVLDLTNLPVTGETVRRCQLTERGMIVAPVNYRSVSGGGT